ncbi:SRPBCC domain-containing protein [Arthrobacter sp. ATA002]|uniref:SRPBCC family protein n=1 Tax=Arthrobacter sp. ATA002 TaxID=2991715 RepID=UPI0022A6DA77|nr:SRPBCC domain-containing protein [Arthrobacter sp. ATA002]WAP51331.1 SRPBCC domain-containing protein [Arthrobacter sp. ATA002]
MTDPVSPQGEENELLLVRHFPVPQQAVYDAWSDPSHAADWWGPEGFTVPAGHVSIDGRVGGTYRACMVNPVTGDELWWGGTLREVDPPNRLALTMDRQAPDGSAVSAETLVSVDFSPHGGGTEMTFRQGPFADRRELNGHQAGWNSAFDRLARYLARHRGA